MHELTYAREVYKIVHKYAKYCKANRVIAIYLVAGTGTGIEQASFQFYWEKLAKGTPFEGSHIEIDYINDDTTLLVDRMRIEDKGGS